MAGRKYFLVTERAESESTYIPSTKPIDNVELGPTIDSDPKAALDTKPIEKSTIESKPAFELKSRIDSCHY